LHWRQRCQFVSWSGTFESLFAADQYAAVSKSPGADEGEKQQSQTSHKRAEESRIEQDEAGRRDEGTNQSQRENKNRNGSDTPHKTRPELMAEMIKLVASWFPDRKFILVVDSLHSGKNVLWKPPTHFDLIAERISGKSGSTTLRHFTGRK
jgi:hypothetical protein